METSPTPAPVLLATADEMLLDDLLRLSAAAEVTPHVEKDLLGLRRHWQSATLVVVGHDLVDPFARTQPPRRPGVLVAATGSPPRLQGPSRAGLASPSPAEAPFQVPGGAGLASPSPAGAPFQVPGGAGLAFLSSRAPSHPPFPVPDDAFVFRRALAIGAEGVYLLPDEESALGDRLADTLDGGVRAATTFAFVGGCGGAGATTLAAAVAVTASRRGVRTMLIDGDPLGGGIDLALGSETGTGARWPDLLNASGRVSAAALRAALPTVADLAVLSWDRSDITALPPEAMRSVLGAAQRSSDLVVVDLPRRTDPAAEEAFVRSTATFLVVPRDVRSCAAAARLVRPLRDVATDLRVVAREPGLGGLSAVDVAKHLSLPLAAKLRFDRDLPALMDKGRFDPRPRGALGRTAGELLDLFGFNGALAA
ncbi:septum site-determining protein Ssd [Kribbella sp. DT2]|uniref:septum site-determining protein Ssd n=1 Tax=Kribbella sp. DT2 TaxID=3393427 RepID=UPI003CF64438